MPALDAGFNFQDVYCYPDPGDATGFSYLPISPTPERDPTGRPTLMLWLSDQGARLQLGVQWAAAEATLHGLPDEIVRRYPERNLARGAIRLMPVPATVEGVTLAIGDGSGTFTDLQTVQSSGFPPYTALFSVGLTASQAALAVRALDGNKHYVKVTYRGRIYWTEGRTQPLEASVSIDAWFPAGSGTSHIHVIRSASNTDNRAIAAGAVPVRLGFDPIDAPVAFVEVWSAGNRIVLRSPRFGPEMLPAGNGALVVKTHYTDGGPPYQAELAWGSWQPPECILNPTDIGLVQVTVDGTAREALGVRSARVHVHYQPADVGTEDDRIAYLGPHPSQNSGAESEWVTSWFVVSRRGGLNGALTYEWEETSADGTITHHSTRAARGAQIRL